MLANDPLKNVLYIDLSRRRFELKDRGDLFSKYIGGAGVAAQLLLEECPAGCEPYAPENPVILAVGPLTGLFPLASKTVAMFKSPHTGNLGQSHAGGRSAVAIRIAGSDWTTWRALPPTPCTASKPSSCGRGSIRRRCASRSGPLRPPPRWAP